ncbi:MAG: FAD-dependent oxidoreductase [Acidimicrobiales bacterium]
MLDAVIVGAGMAGLTAAKALQVAGMTVAVIEQAATVGGRLATHPAGAGRADSGAQFFTARSAEMRSAIAAWSADGAVEEWCRGFGAVTDGHPRYAGTGGMATLATYLAGGLDVRLGAPVRLLDPAAASWRVGSVEARSVIVTVPGAAALDLVAPALPLDPEVVAAVRSLSFHPTLALLVATPRGASVPEPGGVQLNDDPTWSFIADNRRKGVSNTPVVTLHARHDVSARRFAETDGMLVPSLLHAAAPWIGAGPVDDVRLVRWAAAAPRLTLAERCVLLARAPGPLVLAGDAYGGPKVEGAYLSGLAAADAVMG